MVADVHQISGIVAEIGTQETGMQEIAICIPHAGTRSHENGNEMIPFAHGIATATLARTTLIESSST